LEHEEEKAIQGLRLNKAVGYAEISAEEMQAVTSGVGLLVMQEMYQNIWKLKEIPEDWKRFIIIPIFQKKDRLHCGNYRGVSFLSHSSKAFTQILLQRMRKRSDEILSEELGLGQVEHH